MNYASLNSAVQTLFSQSAWTNKNVTIYPDNYQGKISKKDEYGRLNILPTNSENATFGGGKGWSGTVIVSLYVKAGEGQSRLMVLGDHLDDILQNKVLSNGLELGTSYINVLGLDTANTSLYSGKYIIPFKSYGE